VQGGGTIDGLTGRHGGLCSALVAGEGQEVDALVQSGIQVTLIKGHRVDGTGLSDKGVTDVKVGDGMRCRTHAPQLDEAVHCRPGE